MIRFILESHCRVYAEPSNQTVSLYVIVRGGVNVELLREDKIHALFGLWSYFRLMAEGIVSAQMNCNMVEILGLRLNAAQRSHMRGSKF